MGQTVWRDEAARARLEAWFERFRARIPVPVESREVPTRHGPTSGLLCGSARRRTRRCRKTRPAAWVLRVCRSPALMAGRASVG